LWLFFRHNPVIKLQVYPKKRKKKKWFDDEGVKPLPKFFRVAPSPLKPTVEGWLKIFK
jgi:hypothetical protein